MVLEFKKDEVHNYQDIVFDIPSRKLYEDEKVLVFLDINPSTNGDCLLIPKKHVVTIDEIDDDLWIHMLKITKLIKEMLYTKLNCKGLTVVNNNDLGQEIKHFHIHLTPRYENDLVAHSFNAEMLKDLDDVLKSIKED